VTIVTTGPFFRSFPAHCRTARSPGAAFVLLLFTLPALALPAMAQVAAPGDVYYDVHLDHTFKYGPFANNIVVWQNSDHSGTELGFAAARDTVLVSGASSSIATSIVATGGVFRADVNVAIDASARTGLFLYDTNRLIVDVYVRGPSGTPFRTVIASDGDLLASRLGGLPGSLQPVNGVSTVSFGDSTVVVDYSGTVERQAFLPRVHAGQTTTAINVGPDTYSLAGSYSITLVAYTTQAICILGCMTAPADFAAHVDGLVALDVYICDEAGGGGLPCDDVPTAAPDLPAATASLQIEAQPNPFNPRTELVFTAPAGVESTVEIFDARGALVRRLFCAPATGDQQRVTWDAADAASGIYVARVRGGGASAQRKLVLLR
jgi:hypothetical protein